MLVRRPDECFELVICIGANELKYFVNMCFLKSSNYDIHLFIKELSSLEEDIYCIAHKEQKYITDNESIYVICELKGEFNTSKTSKFVDSFLIYGETRWSQFHMTLLKQIY